MLTREQPAPKKKYSKSTQHKHNIDNRLRHIVTREQPASNHTRSEI
jgi:hypothetical protein